ncbi:MAG: ABC transporter substrate-binding protein [Lachnospiraceae bacterium]|nr:ABC transporter substrate-binding protein [Lachnospiraceae bacterium]
MDTEARSGVKKSRLNRHMRGIWLVLLPVMVLLMFMLGWGLGLFTEIEEEPYISETSNQIVVGVSQLGSESGWRTANTESIQRAISKENGFFLIYNNARQKQENQIKAIRNFISQRVDYIVLAPVVESGWETVLQEAKQAGIPVILMDRSVEVEDQSLYTALVGTDSVEEGRKAGRWLEEYLIKKRMSDRDINIVVLKGTEGASAQIGRTAGFSMIAGEHDNWHILEQQYGDFTIYKGKEVMKDLLKKYKDIDVVVSQNDDMTFGAIEAIRESGKTVGVNGDITIISFDAVHDALEMVAEGVINVDIECNPDQGEYVSEVIRLLESGQEVEKRYYVEEDVFTMENVTQEVLDGRTY